MILSLLLVLSAKNLNPADLNSRRGISVVKVSIYSKLKILSWVYSGVGSRPGFDFLAYNSSRALSKYVGNVLR